jgi:hypothetical protein
VHRDHGRTVDLGQLHERRANATRGARDQHCLAGSHPRPIQHPLGGHVRGWKARQLGVAQIRLDPVCVPRRHGDQLGEATVTLASDKAGVEQALTGPRTAERG